MSKNNSKNNSKHEIDVETIAAITEDVAVAVAVEAEPKKARKAKRLTEDQLVEKYPHVVVGTLRFETEGHHIGKQTIEADLPCGHIARVATSDLFQVRQCAECKKATKKAVAKKEEKAEPVAKRPLTSAAYNKPTMPSTILIPEDALTEANA